MVEGSDTSEAKEGAAYSIRAGDIGASVTLGSFCPKGEKEKVVRLDQLAPCQGATPDEQP
jgi:hypothetical protein